MAACPPKLIPSTRMGTLTIGGVELVNSHAWTITDLKPLWEGPDVRGTDRLLPTAAGVIAYPRRATVSKRNLAMVIVGDTDWTGAPYSDDAVGLETNVMYLRAHVIDPTGTGDGTRPAVLTLPSGATRTGNVHVVGLTFGTQQQGKTLATLAIEIPAGALA